MRNPTYHGQESFHRASPWSLGPGFPASHPAVAVTLHPFRFGTSGGGLRVYLVGDFAASLENCRCIHYIYHIVSCVFSNGWRAHPCYHESFNKIDTCSLRAKGSLHHVVSREEGRCLSIFDFASGAPVGSFNTLLLFSIHFLPPKLSTAQ